MKLLRIAALLTPLAFALPMSAHAAMDAKTQAGYMTQCTVAAHEQNPALDVSQVKAHCECGAQQINDHFSDKEIASLNDTNAPRDVKLTEKLQKVVAENCVQSKK